MKFEIKRRFSGSVMFALETESLRLCVEAAIQTGANLYEAHLSGAKLSGAKLSGAKLSGVNLYEADLSGANLSEANLSGADLYGANLSGANLSGAKLYGADLSGANLSGAKLYGANLSGANLSGANLSGANLSEAKLYEAHLSGANLSGAKISDDNTVTKAPIQIAGLHWYVTIWDQHMQVGCEFHSHDVWRGFTDDDWLRMGGKNALYLMREQFPMLIALCDQHNPENRRKNETAC